MKMEPCPGLTDEAVLGPARGGGAMATLRGGEGSLRRSLSPCCVLALMICMFTRRNRDRGPLLPFTHWWVSGAQQPGEGGG